MPPTTTIDITAAKRLLLADHDVGEVADEIGVSKRQLERVFAREVGETPAAWRRAQIGSRTRGAPVLSIRYPRLGELEAVASEARMETSAWARLALDLAVDTTARRMRRMRRKR